MTEKRDLTPDKAVEEMLEIVLSVLDNAESLDEAKAYVKAILNTVKVDK